MVKEIERKFLLNPKYCLEDLNLRNRKFIEDQYLTPNLRIRNINNELKWTITIKSSGKIEREESEFTSLIKPYFNHTNYPILRKYRYIACFKKQNFEVNQFFDIRYMNKPLVLVELEIPSKQTNIHLPEWLGEEVTDDIRFYGHNLALFLSYEDFSYNK